MLPQRFPLDPEMYGTVEEPVRKSAAGVPVLKEEVGIASGVVVMAGKAPETGIMVGTKVGVGRAVGRAGSGPSPAVPA